MEKLQVPACLAAGAVTSGAALGLEGGGGPEVGPFGSPEGKMAERCCSAQGPGGRHPPPSGRGALRWGSGRVEEGRGEREEAGGSRMGRGWSEGAADGASRGLAGGRGLAWLRAGGAEQRRAGGWGAAAEL